MRKIYCFLCVGMSGFTQLIKCRARNKSANQHDRRLKASSSMLPKAAPSNVEGSAAVNTGIHVSDPANEIEHILQNQEDYYRVLKVGPGLIAML